MSWIDCFHTKHIFRGLFIPVYGFNSGVCCDVCALIYKDMTLNVMLHATSLLLDIY